MVCCYGIGQWLIEVTVNTPTIARVGPVMFVPPVTLVHVSSYLAARFNIRKKKTATTVPPENIYPSVQCMWQKLVFAKKVLLQIFLNLVSDKQIK